MKVTRHTEEREPELCNQQHRGNVPSLYKTTLGMPLAHP